MLYQSPPKSCPYLPGRTEVTEGILLDQVPSQLLEQLLDNRFRRSGNYFYRPICPACQACTPLRINVQTFTPSKSQRRILRSNRDVTLNVNPPILTPEKFDLYQRYISAQHTSGSSSSLAAGTPTSWEDLQSFLFSSPVCAPSRTLEFAYRTSDARLIGLGICDLSEQFLSSVYFYWDPAESKRSLGIYSLLAEFGWAAQHNLRWHHLGYWVADSITMHYKATITDHELLTPHGQWTGSARKTPLPNQIHTEPPNK